MNSIDASLTSQLVAAAPLILPMPEGHVRAGFPSPADDFAVNRLDLAQILIKHPQATYLLRVAGHSMRGRALMTATPWWWTARSSLSTGTSWWRWSMVNSR